MRRLVISGLCCLCCAACASGRATEVRVRDVPVPVVVTCQSPIGPAPEMPDTDQALKAAPDLFIRVKLLVAGRLMRIARQRELEAALRGCTDPSSGGAAPTP